MSPYRSLLLFLFLLHLLLSRSPSLAVRPLSHNLHQRGHSTFRIPPAFHQFAAGIWAEFASLLNSGLGDTHASLVPLKRYFAQFGYLNLTSTQNVTSLFDSPTLDALKLYQQSFNLTVSGTLDVPTLLKIMTPRCGREDVTGGIPLMLPSPSFSTNRTFTDTQQVRHYSFFPSTPSWPPTRRNLSYAFSSMNETQRLSADERRQAFANAFSEWAAVVPINFTETNDYDAADIKIEFVSFSHGDAEPFDGVLGILAHAFSPTDGRFHLDDSEFWYSSSAAGGGSSRASEEIDLQSVVTHEIGHLIGLAHSPVENAIMYPSLSPRQVKLQLQQDDIEGAQALYGINPDYNPNNPLPGIPHGIPGHNAHSLGDVNKAYRFPPPPLFLYLLAFCLLQLLACLKTTR